MLWPTVLFCGGAKNVGDLSGGRFFEEQLCHYGKSRENIEQHDKLEREQPERARNLGDIHHPDVIRRLRFQDTSDSLALRPWLRLSWLPSISANCFTAELDSRSSQALSNALASAESHLLHQTNKVTRDIGVAHQRIRYDLSTNASLRLTLARLLRHPLRRQHKPASANPIFVFFAINSLARMLERPGALPESPVRPD